MINIFKQEGQLERIRNQTLKNKANKLHNDASDNKL